MALKLEVHDKVTVITSHFDSIILVMRNHHRVIRAEIDDTGQAVYWTQHPERDDPCVSDIVYGPFPEGRLIKGWV